jgi:UDP-N-acetylglucosamine 2-epimerase
MREVKIKVPDPEKLFPEEFRRHMLNATRELLLAMKSLVDENLKRLEEYEERVKGKKELKKIEIE